MNWVVEIIVDSIVRAITYAIVVSVSTTIRNSIRQSVSKKMISKLEKYVGADGKIDEEKINSLIKVNVYAIGAGLYDVSIDEDVFGILTMNLVTPKDTTQMFRIIQKEITIKKLKAKMRKDTEKYKIIEVLEKGFNK